MWCRRFAGFHFVGVDDHAKYLDMELRVFLEVKLSTLASFIELAMAN